MNENKRSPAKVIAVILIILVLAAAGVFVWLYFHGAPSTAVNQSPQQVVEVFDAAIAADPANVELYLDKAQFHLDNGNVDEAALTYAQGYTATGSAIIAEKLKALGYNDQGKKLKEIPDVSGGTETQAVLELQQMGYITSISEEHSDTISVGKVIGTKPSAGEIIPVGETVTVILSLGVEEVDIPDFTAMKLDEAKKYCEDNHLKFTLNYNDIMGKEKDEILGQSVSVGTQVERGTNVILTVASGQTPETEMKFTFDIPASAEGVFEFTYYVDGVKDESIGRDARNVGLASNKTLEYTVKGRVGDVKTLTIEVTSSKTNRKDTFVVALITLSEQPTSEIKRMNMGIFSQLVS